MYQALYRKWRPMSFDDVISQPAVTATLKNQIREQRTAHAYLFTGSRGTGKTTCARIFAKAVNCEHSNNGNPCLECDVCKDADNFALSDIIEIDAASNNGVDDIRDLREGAVYTPERCRYKVYIIDEVHMLSPSAFNALLKIMEEPPQYVKFILATTEVHKVPATITSRCQRFDFRRILTDDIKERLLYIAGKEGLELSENAALLIGRLSDGGMRDALSLLDQCAAYSEKIDTDTVSMAAGIAGRDSIFEIIEAAASKDPASAISVADRLYAMSKDMSRLCSELTEQFRNIMLIKVCPENTGLIKCMPEEIEKLGSMAARFELDDVLEKLTIMQECNERLGKALNKRIELEMCLVKLCTARRISVPVRVERTEPKSAENVRNIRNADERISDNDKAVPQPEADIKTLKASDFKPLIEWTEILDELTKISPSVSGALSGSRAYIYKNIMLIDTKNKFFLKLFKIKENFKMLSDAIVSVMGKPYVIKARCSANEKDEHKVEGLIEKAVNSGIETAVDG